MDYDPGTRLHAACAGASTRLVTVDMYIYASGRKNSSGLNCSDYLGSTCTPSTVGLLTSTITATGSSFAFDSPQYGFIVTATTNPSSPEQTFTPSEAQLLLNLILAGYGFDTRGNPAVDPRGGATSSASSGPVASPPGGVGKPSAVGSTTEVDGNDGQYYVLTNWGDDTVSDCSGHAYGGPVIAFLRAHPCTSARRRLVTYTDFSGQDLGIVVISMIRATFTGNTAVKSATRLENLETAAGTGGLNDLLREGVRVEIAGAASSVPPTEAFSVRREDATVWIYDAFYARSVTPDQDPALLSIIDALHRTSFDSSQTAPSGTDPGIALLGDAAAKRACVLWRALGVNQTVSGAVLNLYELPAARRAGEGGQRWFTLASAMRTLALLPENHLSDGQLRTAGSASKTITTQCRTLGVTVPS